MMIRNRDAAPQVGKPRKTEVAATATATKKQESESSLQL